MSQIRVGFAFNGMLVFFKQMLHFFGFFWISQASQRSQLVQLLLSKSHPVLNFWRKIFLIILQVQVIRHM